MPQNTLSQPPASDDREPADRPAEQAVAATPESAETQAALSVMHPEAYDPEWRYYHGAWGG